MAKLIAPGLSFKAQGSIGSSLTFRSRGSHTDAIAIPSHRDALTQPQIYQRWLYQDGIWHWHSLSAAQKAQYEKDARPLHMTGFALHMRVYLKTLPDIHAYWKLDDLNAGQALDSGPNKITLTNFGSTPVPGKILGAANFDGLDDRLRAPISSLDLPGPFTIETLAFIHSLPTGTYPQFLYNNVDTTGFRIQGYADLRLALILQFNGYDKRCFTPYGSLTFNHWHYITAIYDLVDLKIQLNATVYTGETSAILIAPANTYGYLGSINGAAWSALDGIQDHVIIWNRALSPEQRLAHARRYGIIP